MMQELIQPSALVLSIIGAWRVARGGSTGFKVWIVSNLLWLTDSLGRYDVWQSILWGYYIITCVLAIRRIER